MRNILSRPNLAFHYMLLAVLGLTLLWPTEASASCAYEGRNINCKPQWVLKMFGKPCAPLTNLTDHALDIPYETWIINEDTPKKSQEMVTQHLKLAPRETTIHRDTGLIKCGGEDCRNVIAVGKSCI